MIFDLGGVVLASPLHVIARFEEERGIPLGFVNELVLENAPTGAWSRLERGELDIESFCPVFDEECESRGHLLPAADLMSAIASKSGPRENMLQALRRIREHGLQTAALTNNWSNDGQDPHQLRPLFDHYVESSVVGLRKPDPEIYEMVLGLADASPTEAAFLDDIGTNLKPARAMGIRTIKVVTPEQALAELEEVVGFSLA